MDIKKDYNINTKECTTVFIDKDLENDINTIFEKTRELYTKREVFLSTEVKQQRMVCKSLKVASFLGMTIVGALGVTQIDNKMHPIIALSSGIIGTVGYGFPFKSDKHYRNVDADVLYKEKNEKITDTKDDKQSIKEEAYMMCAQQLKEGNKIDNNLISALKKDWGQKYPHLVQSVPAPTL